MKKQWMALALTLAILLPGCKAPAPPELDEEEIQEQQEQILSDPETMGQVIARIGSETLTNGQLQSYFWAAVGEYQKTQPEIAPDYSQDLGEQLCPLDPEGGSWRDYFLNQALQMWHTCQALALQGEQEGVPTEEAYQPDPEKHEKYMTGMPATRYLYGYSQSYQPNTMHQAFLDNVDALLEDLAQKTGCADPEKLASRGFGTTLENLRDFVTLYNWGYMYYTTLSYDLEPTQEQVESCLQQEGQVCPEPEGEMCCDVRHILLLPESDTEEGWEACMQQAQDLLKTWQKSFRVTEDTFASLANQYSQDTGTAVDGGGYYRLRRGQLLTQMDAWCFDPERQPGDTALFRTSKGVHILYFSGAESARTLWAEDRCREQMMKNLIASAREAYPMEVEREEIVLVPAQPLAGASDLLYPDVGHERFPEVPLYLQQDYGFTKFGNYNLSTNGCGITSFAMVSSYLSDEEWTPPELCARYGNYSYAHGTDGMIFEKESAALGCYLQEKTYEPSVAKKALEEGHIVVSIQHKGYWTSGGHYIVLEKVNEDGTIQVRDSNLYNYWKYKVPAHAQDRHAWSSITAAGSCYWIFAYKAVTIPACSRCGQPETVPDSILREEYCCHKCTEALLRRDTYLKASGQNWT